MIVLDTNVVSEAMKPTPDLAVRTWLNDQVAETLYLPTRLMACSNCSTTACCHSTLRPLGTMRTLRQARGQGGKGFPTPDGYIAAIAASKGFTIATRDTSPFEAAGVPVVATLTQPAGPTFLGLSP